MVGDLEIGRGDTHGVTLGCEQDAGEHGQATLAGQDGGLAGGRHARPEDPARATRRPGEILKRSASPD
jgi:hypothetical protein